MTLSPAVKYILKVILPVFVLATCLPFHTGFSWQTVISFFISYFLVYQLSANLYHRYWSHRQLDLNPLFEKIISFMGLFAMTGDPLSFARTHRWHHLHADTDKDVHSPIHGRFHSFLGWLFKKSPISGTLVEDLLKPEYQYLQSLSRNKVKIIWITLLLIALVSLNILLGILWAMCLALLLEMIANTFAHSVRRRQARNLRILAWLSLGSYHYDHHVNPRILKKNDPGYFLLQLLEFLNLAKIHEAL